MTERQIDLMTALGGPRKRYAKAAMFFEGKLIGNSYRPIEDAARHLLTNGLASPGDKITFSRDGKLCFSSTVGAAASPRKGAGASVVTPPHSVTESVQ